MASADLAVDLSALSLSTPSCVRFRPTGDRAWLQERLDDIPRYLFRVFTPESGGETNRSWTKSRDARFDGEMSIVDILARQDDYQVANMLNRHLRWWPCSEDNFVSWTSSLLFALQYTFFLHISDRDRSTFDDIKICIIDTTNFAEGVFLRDMDLIQAYRSLGPGLKNLWDLRSRKHDDLARSFYFGEYLSQGALKIEGKCEIVSTQEIIDHGLFHLQPEFEKAAMWEPIPNTRPPWANEVIRLREVFYQRTTERQSIDQEELQAAIRIASLFEPRWRLPVAANFIALLPRRDGDSAIQQAFREPHFTAEDRINCAPAKTKVVPYETLPKVQQFDTIIRMIFKDFCLSTIGKMKENFEDAEDRLHNAIVHSSGVDWKADGIEAIPTESSYRAMLRQLDSVILVCQSLRQEILGAREEAE